ncbi:MAG: hypothetical protein QXR48_00510 [Candidatus Woesearchaeota archaeon]
MKKAQIKMFETVGVLVVFFFILIGGTIFYFNMQKSALQKEMFKQSQLRSLKSAQRAVFLPELDCSFASVQRENCFDTFKLAAIREMGRDQNVREIYFKTFGYMNLSVREVYPGTGFDWVVYEMLPDQYSSALKSQLPVLLYNPVTRDSSFGVMEVTTYAAR